MEYSSEKKFISEKVKTAYSTTTDGSPKTVLQKSEFDLVTEVDKNIEDYLIAEIGKAYPSDNIVSEETHAEARVDGRTWIIDPIDGTCNFAHGIALYGVQVALCDKGRPVMSYLYLPTLDEEYYAMIGKGAFLNGKKTVVSKDTKLQNAIVDMGDFSHRFEDLALIQLKFVNIIRSKIGKMRILGSACADFCFLSAGRTDAYVIMTDNLWDLVPGAFLAEEAGATVTNLYGKPYSFGDFGIVAAATPSLSSLLVSALEFSRQ